MYQMRRFPPDLNVQKLDETSIKFSKWDVKPFIAFLPVTVDCVATTVITRHVPDTESW